MPLKFLFIDDDCTMIDIYEYLFTDNFPDAIVKKAHNNEEAWQTLKDFTPDIIITDLIHPGGSGLDFLRELHQDLNKCSIPVICVTGNAMIFKGLEEFNAVFKKPIRLRTLIDRVKEILPQHFL